MPTRAECQQGVHTPDNQGLCWWCGAIIDPYLYEQYFGKSSDGPDIDRDTRPMASNKPRQPVINLRKKGEKQ